MMSHKKKRQMFPLFSDLTLLLAVSGSLAALAGPEADCRRRDGSEEPARWHARWLAER